jgi:hypothetical protein
MPRPARLPVVTARARVRPARRWSSVAVKTLVASSVVLSLASCAALESWDRFAQTGSQDSGAGRRDVEGPEEDADQDGGGTGVVPITPVQIAFSAVNGDVADASVVFDMEQLEGDTNVVAIGWYDSDGDVTEPVTDSKGNTYVRIGEKRVVFSGDAPLSQVIFFAKKIHAAGKGENRINVAWGSPVDGPDVRAVEYAGLDPDDPLIGEVFEDGDDLTASTGEIEVKDSHALLFAALVTESEASEPGQNFVKRILTGSQNFVQDRIVEKPGRYATDLRLVPPSDTWLLQLVAFRGVAAR